MTNRRTFGSIDRLQSGRWRVRYRDADGRRRTAGSFVAKADASRFLATVEADLLRGDWRDPTLVNVNSPPGPANGRARSCTWLRRPKSNT